MKHSKLLISLVAAGMKQRYGDKPAKEIMLRSLWERKHIIDAGFTDYYIMAYQIFNQYAAAAGINVWARGATPSSVVCYCLGLTEIDPIKYGLCSVCFVNDRTPHFQFDIEGDRYDEFMKGAEMLLQAKAKDFDIPSIRKCLFRNEPIGKQRRIISVSPCDYLGTKHERPIPEDIDDEIARYALSFPKKGKSMDLYEAYMQEPRAFDQLIYQEEMLDILRHTFNIDSIKANDIRIAIQTCETEQVECYRKEIFGDLNDTSIQEAEAAWQRLNSNPHAFLKAHAVSQVVARYKFDTNAKKDMIKMRQSEIQKRITCRDNESLNKYLAEIGRTPLISIEEEVELTKLIKKGGPAGELAKNKLVTANLRFVVSVAKQYQHRGLPLNDLINEGNIGLIKAAKKFDETRGFRFISYAVWWVRQSILLAIAAHKRIMCVPQDEVERLSRIKHDDSHIDRKIDHESLAQEFNAVLKRVLKEREAFIIRECYGVGCPEKGLDDIAKELGLTRERVRQIREKSIEKLRNSGNAEILIKYLG